MCIRLNKTASYAKLIGIFSRYAASKKKKNRCSVTLSFFLSFFFAGGGEGRRGMVTSCDYFLVLIIHNIFIDFMLSFWREPKSNYILKLEKVLAFFLPFFYTSYTVDGKKFKLNVDGE